MSYPVLILQTSIIKADKVMRAEIYVCSIGNLDGESYFINDNRISRGRTKMLNLKSTCNILFKKN